MSPSQSGLLIGGLAHARKEWDDCASLLSLKEYPNGSRDDFLAKAKSGDFDDVVALYRSNDSTKITGPFDKEMIDALPASLKYICHNGAGYDNIDIAACTQKGISVSSTPIAVNDATADVAIFLLLGALRRITYPFLSVRSGAWRGPKFEIGHDPKNKVLGIIGMGGIGQAVAHRARAFGMKIHYYNRRQLPKDQEGDAKYVSFDELLQTSDVISLNLSLNAATTHLIGKAEFDKMKPGVIIINTARGPIIDEAALVAALEEGKVWSAGLDVFEEEPKIHPGLISREDVVLLPHIGTGTSETQKEMEVLVIDNIKSAVTNGTLLTQVPEQKN